MYSVAQTNSFDVSSTRIGHLEPVADAMVEEEFRELLVHEKHMTQVLEAHNGVSIEVEVLEASRSGNRYRREVLLRRSDDQVVTQYAVLNVDLGSLSDETVQDLLNCREPFGRVLSRRAGSSRIDRRVMFRAEISETLARFVEVEPGTRTYARLVGLIVDGIEVGEAFEVIMPGQARAR